MHEVRWETTLYEPVFRKLVNESFGIFLSLQKLAEVGVWGFDQLIRRTILINMKSQMHSCDNWSTGVSVSTVQERDKRLPNQLENLADTGTAAQSVAYFYKSVAVGVDVQAIVDLAPCGDPVHGQQPGGSSCPTFLTGSLFISLPVRSEPGMSPQSVTCICEVIFLQVSSVTGRRQPGAAWGLLGGGQPVCPPGSR